LGSLWKELWKEHRAIFKTQGVHITNNLKLIMFDSLTKFYQFFILTFILKTLKPSHKITHFLTFYLHKIH